MKRRSFLWIGAVFATPAIASRPGNRETVYRLAAGDWDVRMAVEFFDNYSSNGFWFRERMAERRFCLSGNGKENVACLPNFIGSVAVARYHIEQHAHSPKPHMLRERVRTIDQDDRIASRPPFERIIELQDGVASDIQAFGYQVDSSSPSREPAASNGPWCLLRQDLYLEGQDSLFLVLHWKHTLNAIRLFDVIPGDRTRVIAEPDDSGRRVR
jgi:hypothetical protein